MFKVPVLKLKTYVKLAITRIWRNAFLRVDIIPQIVPKYKLIVTWMNLLSKNKYKLNEVKEPMRHYIAPINVGFWNFRRCYATLLTSMMYKLLTFPYQI